MSGPRRLLVLTGIGMVLLWTTSVVAGDWPQWRGAGRDGKAADFEAPEAWPKELTRKWSVPVGAGDATPALVDGKLYVFARQSNEEVNLCLNAASGEQIWRDGYEAPGVESGPARAHSGPRSSPAIANGKVVTLNLNGVLSCLNAADGNLLWYKDPYSGVVPRFYTSSSPIIVGQIAIGQFGGGDKGGIIAYDLNSGDEKWKWDGDGADYSSPVVMKVGDDTHVVAMTSSNVVAISTTSGAVAWKIPFAPERMSYNAPTPVVDGQTVIYTAAGRGTYAAKIVKQADGFAVEPLWSNTEIASKFSTPVLKDGRLYGVTDRGIIFCLDAKTGERLWVSPSAYDRQGYGAVVDAGAVMLVLPSNGELVVFKPSATEFSELAKIKLSDGETFAHPVVAGKNIFVKDTASLSLWSLP